MTTARLRSSSAIAAGVCAVVTIVVFFGLQDYGPGSAIRRFNEALLLRNVNELQAVTLEPVTADSVRFLVNQIGPVIANGPQPQIARMERQPGQVRAAVLYTLPDGSRWAVIWVVEKHDRLWKVNATKTATILRDSFQL